MVSINEKMRAVVIADDRSLQTAAIEVPSIGQHDARVRVRRCGICGSDLHARRNPRYPAGCVLGHEIAGEVVEIGSEVDGWTLGDRVALYHALACGECAMCHAGKSHMCFNALSTSLGLGTVQGGYAEQLVVPARIMQRVPDALTDDQAALAEPLSISIHGVHKAKVAPGDPVCVLGGGPIGAMVAASLRARDIDSLVVEPNEQRAAMLTAMGFSTVGLDDVAKTVVDVLGAAPIAVLECSGHPTAAGLAVELVDYTGRVVLQGVPREQVPISQFAVVQKEVELVGAASCTPGELSEALDDLAAGRIPSDLLVTAVASLDDANDLFDEMTAPHNPHMKVLLDPERTA